MKELLSKPGGQGMFIDDLVTLQKEALAGCEQILHNLQPCVLSGCEVSQNPDLTYNITSGYVWLGLKIRFFSGETDIASGQLSPIDAEETFRPFADASNKAIFKNYYAIITAIDASPSPIKVSPSGVLRITLQDALEVYLSNKASVAYVNNQLNFKIDKTQETWRRVGTAGNPAYQNYFSDYLYPPLNSGLFFRKTQWGSVQFKGNMQTGALSDAFLPFLTLPPDYRPSFRIEVPMCEITNGTRTTRQCIIEADGTMYFGGEPSYLAPGYSLNFEFYI
jgi:hypothetical protein